MVNLKADFAYLLQIQNFRKKAVDLAKQIGKYILEELPPFIQPAKDLVKHATDLMSRVKSDFMDFYNVGIHFS